MSSLENKKHQKFGTSFSSSLRGSGAQDLEESFKVGDFSSKHFTRKSSLHTQRELPSDGQDFTTDSPNTKKIEGGFEDKTGLNQNHKGVSSKKNSTNGLTSLISTSFKADSPLLQQPTPLESPSKAASILNTIASASGSPIKQSSADPRLRSASPRPTSDSPNLEIDINNPHPSTVEVVGRHLVTENDVSSLKSKSTVNDEFDSLHLQGGDISREVYNWQRDHSQPHNARRRSQSFSGSVHGSLVEPDFQVHDIRVPGGFRRSFLIQKASRQNLLNNDTNQTPTLFTRNFIEFLAIYGHFAGEELRDEDDEDDEYHRGDFDNDEESLLLPSVSPSNQPADSHKATTTKAVLLLLKAFIGTGVLFLPRGFRNAGWAFGVISLVIFAILSYHCFMLLIRVRIHLGAASYGDIGQKLFGPRMRQAILAAIVLSQIGFAAAYIIFTATNLQAFFTATADISLSLEFYIILQVAIFTPLSLTRKIAKLSGTALVADLFIFLGLLYVYYYCSFVLIAKGLAPVKTFNSDWSVFIGTAIFTYEGIGLLIPIEESMKHPSKFPTILGWVIFVATFVFISSGLLGYLSFGSGTETVILLNFDQSILVNIVQFLYSMAILLSTPLQLFPAIRILENALIKKSGKYDSSIKWQKNYFRIALVAATALLAWGGASDLDKFVAIVGSFACIPLIYVFPPLLHYVSLADTVSTKIIDGSILALGIIMMFYTSLQTISEWVR